MNWTTDQRRGIETAGRSLLVSAAAGSGKTAVLAARCAYLVCDAPPPHRCDVDELLVVTFTKAAAAEMRNRIERALRERLASGPYDARLARQLMLLDRAHVSTLHSFCTSVLKRHFNLVGLDPNFRTLDEDEAFLLRMETARQLVEDRYESDVSGAFQQFIDAYADGDDERVLRRVVHAHAMLCSVVDPEGWLNRARARIADASDAALAQSELGREMIGLVRSRLGDYRRRCVDAAAQFGATEHFVPYAEYVNELIAAIDEVAATFGAGDFDKLARAVKAFAFPPLPKMPSSIPGKDDAKKQLDKLRHELDEGGALYQLCRFTTQDWRDGLRYILPGVDEFVGLVRDYGRRFQQAKRELGALDFNDLERLTLDVLRARDGRPSAAARVFHNQFRHVLVDEYQDVNEVQDEILRLVSRECVCGEDGAVQNLFCVGDVKQSIYRFRLANPARFIARNERLRTCEDETIGEVVDLQSNFRSRAPLLDALNRVFERLMTAPAAEIDYDESHRLRAGATYPPNGSVTCFGGAPIEMHVLPDTTAPGDEPSEAEVELDRTEREAAFVARRILDLMDESNPNRAHVFDTADDGSPLLRPIRFKDVVILLRAAQNKATEFADALRAQRIPVHSDSGGGLFASTEIRDLLALLDVLDNLQQDIPLAAVLRSPLSGLAEADDAMARIRLAYPGSSKVHVPFHRAVVRYANERDDELAAHLRDLLAQLRDWRTLAGQRPIAEVLWTVYDETGYLAFCAGLDDGEQRVANLTRLHERARQFGTFQRQGLRRFIQFLRSLQDDERDLHQPSVASEADDVVRVMSIHASKGLEFPVVILPDLGKKHNLQDIAGPILIDRDAGLGLLCADETKRIRYPSMASVLVSERIRRQSLAEEMRVLYVAMTRAREHLILVGTGKPDLPEKWARRWIGHEGPIPADEVLRGACMLDWLGPVAAAASQLSPRPIEIRTHTDEEMRARASRALQRQKPSERQQKLARLEPLDPAPPSNMDAERIRRRLTTPYHHRAFTRLAASQTVGSLTKTGRSAFAGEHVSREQIVRFGQELPAPRCVLESLSVSPLDVGATTHLVLQHLDFARPCTRDDVKQQIAQMVARKHVARGGAEVVDVDAIVWLASTELGRLLRDRSTALLRELPVFFPMQVEPSSEPFDRVMVRGRIDVMVPTDDGIVLVDYKTDRVTHETIDARAEFYRPQVESYSRAIEGIVGVPVTAACLVFLSAREVISLSPGARAGQK